jgi:site-specific DNA-cytosine methylase
MKDTNHLVDDSLTPDEMFIKTLKNIPHSKGTKDEIRWAAIIPLIGGFPLGVAKELQIKPEYIMSYPAFEGNDSNLLDYWEDVPYYQLNEDNNREIIRENREDLEKPLSLTKRKGCKKCKVNSVDIVVGTPPCAGLSMLNAQANDASVRGSEAAVNKWIFMSTDYVLNEIQPQVYLIENAPNAFSTMGRPLAEKLAEACEAAGYKLQLNKTSTHFHGLPQARHRTFYVITKGHLPKLTQDVTRRPSLTHFFNSVPDGVVPQEQKDMGKDIFDTKLMMKWATEVDKKYTLADFMNSNNPTYTSYLLENGILDAVVEIGKKYATVDETKLVASKRSDAAGNLRYLMHVQNKCGMGKGWWDGSPLNFVKRGYTSAIIAKQFWRIVHPDLDRFVCMKEDALLMGLPLDFNHIANHNHIAQNVPTFAAAAITRVAIKFVKGELEKTNWDFARFRNDTGQYIETISLQNPLF